MLSMAVNVLGGYLRPGMEYEDLNFTRVDSPLGSTPGVGVEAQHEPAPETPEHKRIVAQARRDAALLKLDSSRHIAQIMASSDPGADPGGDPGGGGSPKASEAPKTGPEELS